MTTKQRAARWQGFLPPSTLVMGRAGACPSTEEGNPNADLVFMGAEEGAEGNELLHKMIEAMGLSLKEVLHIQFLNSCEACLKAKLQTLRPKVFVILGTLPGFSETRGEVQPLPSGAKMIATYAPSFLLRNPNSKREAWSDLQKVAKELGIDLPKRT
jgi:DNA polymerase